MVGPGRRRHGDHRELLARLHEEHSARMTRFCQRALPLGRRADAEDIVQRVFMEATARCHRDPSAVDEPWLMVRLRSRIQDFYRSERRVVRLLEAVASAERSISVEDVAIDRTRVADLLATIPDRSDRLLLALKLRGYCEAQIAERLGLNPEGRQVRDRLRRLRQQAARWRKPDDD
jgi:RNA polymerase sigma factor (sigma-70 family)